MDMVQTDAERFNDEKEETVKDESKQKTEDTIKLEDKENQQKKNSFAEKVIAHIINKLEITIVNVHLRYEDNYSNPKRPFSFGVLLELLQFKTKDENGEECVVKGAVTQIVKFTTVRSLAVYWKSESKHFDYGKKTEDWFKKTNDVYDREKDAGFRYLIKPISPSAKLILNTNPKLKKSPKILLTVELDDISVVLSKVQFDNILEMIESFEKVKSLRKIKEKRPVVPLKDHDNEWTNIMEKYKEVYAKKLDGQKITKEIQDTIDYCERNLNVNTKAFVQQIAEVETAKRKKAKNKSDEIIEDISKLIETFNVREY
ncbi:VPS13A_C [Mytilus coruscus]|uniref:VPS13A_C n=1 Tax=Mytilus coruscus TaxID=42192 RepID=A0A6J8EWQ7_MYTCO|nr:VPS13A_C [Mytilus coruscus]